MKHLALGRALKHAFTLAWKHKGILVPLYLVLLIVEVANFFLPLPFFPSICFGLLGFYCAIVKTKLLLVIHDKMTLSWQRVKPSFDNYISYLVLVLGLGLLVLPLILFPGALLSRHVVIKTLLGVFTIFALVFLYVRYLFILPIIVDKKYGPAQALKRSAMLTRGLFFKLFPLILFFDFPFLLRMLLSYAYMIEFKQAELANMVGMKPLFVSFWAQKMVTSVSLIAWFTIVPVIALMFIHVYRTLEPKKR